MQQQQPIWALGLAACTTCTNRSGNDQAMRKKRMRDDPELRCKFHPHSSENNSTYLMTFYLLILILEAQVQFEYRN